MPNLSVFLLCFVTVICCSSWTLAQDKAVSPKKVETAKSAPTAKENVTVNVEIETTMGNITLELDSEKAPLSVQNFLNYVDKDFYNDLVFHRVISDFMIQGGGFDKDLKQRPTEAPIKNEAHNGLKNLKGTIAMARTPDPHSASSQFFINLKDNDFLNYKGPLPNDYGYAVFGKVTGGMDVVEKIALTPTTSQGPMRDVPAQPVIIKSIKRK
jgi:cyclophilin family peptidyl-prolyl cis-trans isomerase